MDFIRRNKSSFAAVFLLLLIFGLPSLWYPFGRDQGIHAQVGAAWLDGQLPYREVWHTKGFLSFLPHALVTAVFGHTMWGIRVLDFVWQFGSGLLIFSIGLRRMTKWGAVLAAGMYYLVYYAFGYWHLAQPEGFLTPFALLAILLYDQADKANRPNFLLFVSGLIIALAPWFKQTAVVFIGALLVWAIYDGWRTEQKWDRARPVLGGVLLASGVMVAITAVTGMLQPMLEAFGYAFFDYPQIDPEGPLELVRLSIAWGTEFPILIFPFAAGLGYLIYNRDIWPSWLGIGLMALAGLAGIYIQRQLWFYHWVSSLPFLILIGAFLLESSWKALQSVQEKKRHAFAWFFVLVCISLVLPPLNRNLTYDFRLAMYLSGRVSRADYLVDFFEIEEIIDAAEYLSSHTGENEGIFIWGHYAMIYYLADRPNPTRFINDPPLSLEHGRLAAFRQEVAEDLAASPPAYIIVATDDATSFEPESSREQLPDFTALAGFLASRYELETTIGTLEIYRSVGD